MAREYLCLLWRFLSSASALRGFLGLCHACEWFSPDALPRSPRAHFTDMPFVQKPTPNSTPRRCSESSVIIPPYEYSSIRSNLQSVLELHWLYCYITKNQESGLAIWTMIRILALAVTESSLDYQPEFVEVLKRRANHGQFVGAICSNAIKQK